MIRLKALLMEGIVFTSEFLELIKKWENDKAFSRSGWNEKKKRWYPHPSPEGGLKTIGYGHKIQSAAEQSMYERNGLSDAEAEELFRDNLKTAEAKAKLLINTYDKLPTEVKQALINACYRGELGTKKTPNTLKLMNQGKWDIAAREYLNHSEYQSAKPDSTVKKRMNWNYEQFRNLAKSEKSIEAPTTTDTQTSQPIGKTVYPTKKNGYVNVRSQSYVDNGIIDNLDTKVMYPKPVGYIKQVVTGEDGNTWYEVVLMNKDTGYVRADAVTMTNESEYEVQSGDTLTKIATNKNTTVDNILKKNPGLDPTKLQIGQKIKI
jgi:LysM repeat protein/GH24 family phage-related lysozyme (muramidase)